MLNPNCMNDVLGIVLAGGEGQRLYPLTAHRAKPAVYFGGIYRLIDFTLSNCINSGLRRIFVLVQYKSFSLSRHIRRAWQDVVHTELNEYIEIVPPQKRVSDTWYLGTADAIYQNIYSIEAENPRYVMILSSDHIYKMNYCKLVQFHQDAGADLTVGAIVVPIEEASRYGVLQVDTDLRVWDFEEKPQVPNEMTGHRGVALASMGVYCFNTDVLKQACREDASLHTSHDFGKDILPRLVKSNRVYAFSFQDENRKQAQYWRDVGTLDTYYEANMDLAQIEPLLNLYDNDWPIRTLQPMSPPAKFVFDDYGNRFGAAVDSIVGGGCVLSGGIVRRSILSPNVRVRSYSEVEDSILFSNVDIGRHCRIRRAIIEKDIVLPPGTVIGHDMEADTKRFTVSEGGVVTVQRPPA